jgi:hypothetical protein
MSRKSENFNEKICKRRSVGDGGCARLNPMIVPLGGLQSSWGFRHNDPPESTPDETLAGGHQVDKIPPPSIPAHHVGIFTLASLLSIRSEGVKVIITVLARGSVDVGFSPRIEGNVFGHIGAIPGVSPGVFAQSVQTLGS